MAAMMLLRIPDLLSPSRPTAGWLEPADDSQVATAVLCCAGDVDAGLTLYGVECRRTIGPGPGASFVLGGVVEAGCNAA